MNSGGKRSRPARSHRLETPAEDGAGQQYVQAPHQQERGKNQVGRAKRMTNRPGGDDGSNFRRKPARIPPDKPEQQRIGRNRRDDRRQTAPCDAEARDHSGHSTRHHSGRDADQKQIFISAGNLGDECRRQPDGARYAQVNPALLRHHRLAGRDDGKNRGKGQHRQQRGWCHACRNKDGAQQEERDNGKPDDRIWRGEEPPHDGTLRHPKRLFESARKAARRQR